MGGGGRRKVGLGCFGDGEVWLCWGVLDGSNWVGLAKIKHTPPHTRTRTHIYIYIMTQKQNPKTTKHNNTHHSSLMMFVHCKLSLDRLHLMISKSTTPDFLKMVHKLEEFFTQQLTSGKRALLTFSTVNRSKNKKEDGAFAVVCLLLWCGMVLCECCFAGVVL